MQRKQPKRHKVTRNGKTFWRGHGSHPDNLATGKEFDHLFTKNGMSKTGLKAMAAEHAKKMQKDINNELRYHKARLIAHKNALNDTPVNPDYHKEEIKKLLLRKKNFAKKK